MKPMKLTNAMNINEAIVKSISRDWYGGSQELRDASVTGLIQPPKIFHLNKRHKDEIIEEASDKIFMLLGSAAHLLLERASDTDARYIIKQRLDVFFDALEQPGALKDVMSIFQDTVVQNDFTSLCTEIVDDRYIVEKRFRYVSKSGKVITGGIDLMDTKTHELSDWKLTSIWTYIYLNKEGSRKSDFEEQLNLYRLFLERAGIQVDKLSINLIFRDWQKSASARDANYPKPIEHIDIPTWGLDVAEAFLENKISEIEKYETMSDDMIPECDKLQRWQSNDQWAVTKVGNKRALKLHYSYGDAMSHIGQLSVEKPKEKYAVTKRMGKCMRCESYCNVNKFCHFYRNEVLPTLTDSED